MTHHAPIHPAASDDADPNCQTEARSGERWTAAKMAAFLRALAATHSVSAAARSAGMSRQSAYRLRARLKGKAFDLAWDAAFHHSYQNLPYAALDRALNGIEVPHYYKGELIGTSRRFDERLTVALLKLATPAKVLVVGGDGPAALRQGERFAGLLARVEADGEQAVADAGDAAGGDDFRANPTDLSPMSDAALMAQLRGFPGGGEG
jgi:hypothetical protein